MRTITFCQLDYMINYFYIYQLQLDYLLILE